MANPLVNKDSDVGLDSASAIWMGHEPQADDVLIVLGNAPDTLLAKRIAHILVEEQLAACVNLGAMGLSMYLWQDQLEGSEEVALTMKTTGARVQALIDRFTQLHPHDVPEVLVLPVLGGSASYLKWVREVCIGRSAPSTKDK